MLRRIAVFVLLLGILPVVSHALPALCPWNLGPDAPAASAPPRAGSPTTENTGKSGSLNTCRFMLFFPRFRDRGKGLHRRFPGHAGRVERTLFSPASATRGR
jgi:hypothetical protein